MNSYTGSFSSCIDRDCEIYYTYSLYADTGGCGTFTASGGITLSCDCLYEVWLTVSDGKVVLRFYKYCPGDCSGPGSVSSEGVQPFKTVVLGSVDEASNPSGSSGKLTPLEQK